MIYTAFTVPSDLTLQWQAELLEESWARARQSGELVRLAPTSAEQSAPMHGRARVVQTLSWNPHPYTSDTYAGYDIPAASMEWLFRSRVDGTVLLLDRCSVLTTAIEYETTPGQVVAAPWPEMPTGDGPLGLPIELKFLERYCVNRNLALAPVRLPFLIHSSDLRKIAPRWAELTAIIRCEARGVDGKRGDADRIAYTLAAAEYRLQHSYPDPKSETAGTGANAAVLDYAEPIESSSGEILWDQRTYQPWTTIDPEQAKAGAGRKFLALLNDIVQRRQSGADLAATRPLRRGGIREARILDDMQLEVPGHPDSVTLNCSAAAIWELCDGKHSLAQIVAELEDRFDAPRDVLLHAVRSTAVELVTAGALELEEIG
jgi:hypothetical protein